MKSLEFNFSHPVKGLARLSLLSQLIPQYHHIKVDSKGSNHLKIDINKFKDGEWKLTLEWEHMGCLFIFNKTFVIKKGHSVINER